MNITKLKMRIYEPLEKEIQKACLDYLWAKRIFCWKEHSSGMMVDNGKRFMPIGLKGKADIMGVLPDGRFLAIEIKRHSGVVSPAQLDFLANIRKNGGVAFIARSIDDIVAQGI